MKNKSFYWDWKESPPFQEIIEAAKAMSNPKVYEIHQHSDEHEILLSENWNLPEEMALEKFRFLRNAESMQILDKYEAWYREEAGLYSVIIDELNIAFCSPTEEGIRERGEFIIESALNYKKKFG